MKTLVRQEFQSISVQTLKKYVSNPEKVFSEFENFILENSTSSNIDECLSTYFQIKITNGKKVIVPRNYVGVISFGNNFQIEILPKIAVEDDPNSVKLKSIFLEMLKSVKDYQDIGKIFNEAYLEEKKLPLLEIFISMFLSELESLIKKGIKSDYLSVSQNSKFFKGKILISQDIKKNLIRKDRFYISYDEYNVNRPENRLIVSILNLLLRLSTSWSNKKKIMKLLKYFDGIKASKFIKQDLNSVKIDRTTMHYSRVMELAELFLLGKGFTNFSGRNKVISILFPMEKLFESFIYLKLKEHLQGGTVDAQVTEKYIFEEPKRFNLRPDIRISLNNKSFILDTKWKKLNNSLAGNFGVDGNDMSKMYTYGHKYETSENFLLYPKDKLSPEDTDGVVRKYISKENKNVTIYLLDLLNIDHSIKSLIKHLSVL